MKRILFLCFIMMGFLEVGAQDKESHRERIKSLKTAYITKGLNLTSEEAQQFWPIYNKYESERRKLYKEEYADIENLECLTEHRAEDMLENYVELEHQDYLLKKRFFSDLKDIFPPTRIIKLKKVENEFNRKLLKEYRERKAKESEST